MNRLKWGKAPRLCGIHAELVKADGNAEVMSLHIVLCSAGTQASSQLTGRGALFSLSRKGRVIAGTATTTRGVKPLSVPVKVFARKILDGVCNYLLEHQHPEQSGFTPKEVHD